MFAFNGCLACELERVSQEKSEILKRLHELHVACCSENMPCPWCWGRLKAYEPEEHDPSCLWLTVPKVV